jgi:hypothetical protein
VGLTAPGVAAAHSGGSAARALTCYKRCVKERTVITRRALLTGVGLASMLTLGGCLCGNCGGSSSSSSNKSKSKKSKSKKKK